MASTPSPVQDTSATTLAAVIEILERREAFSRKTYEEHYTLLRIDEHIYHAMSREEDARAVIELCEHAARWTEAQTALAAVRALTASPTP